MPHSIRIIGLRNKAAGISVSIGQSLIQLEMHKKRVYETAGYAFQSDKASFN